MTKKEAYMIGKLIVSYYEQIDFNQSKLDAWYVILQAYEFEQVKEALERFVKHSPYPPTVRDLLQREKVNVPGYEETMNLLETNGESPAREVVQQELAKMRAILGIGGDRR